MFECFSKAFIAFSDEYKSSCYIKATLYHKLFLPELNNKKSVLTFIQSSLQCSFFFFSLPPSLLPSLPLSLQFFLLSFVSCFIVMAMPSFSHSSTNLLHVPPSFPFSSSNNRKYIFFFLVQLFYTCSTQVRHYFLHSLKTSLLSSSLSFLAPPLSTSQDSQATYI